MYHYLYSNVYDAFDLCEGTVIFHMYVNNDNGYQTHKYDEGTKSLLRLSRGITAFESDPDLFLLNVDAGVAAAALE